MASSSLSELLRNGDKTKVRIGCRDQMDAYAEVLQKMGSVYGDVEVADYESIEVAEIKAKEASNGLGNFNLASDVADMDGLFESNQMAAVEIRPMLDFTFTKDQQVKATAFSLRQLAGGRTIEGRLLSVPSTFDLTSIDACSKDNTGDFVVGCSVPLSGDFAAKYIKKFYNDAITPADLAKIANAGLLWGEVFFPVEGGSAKVMVCRVIDECDGVPYTDITRNLTYYTCYIPTPLLTLNGYNDSFQICDFDGQPVTPSYQSSATYSYLKGTISGFSPATVKQYISQQGSLFCDSNVSITKWPGVDANGNTAFGRFRFCIPDQKASEAKDTIGKELPQALIGISDKSMAQGVAATPVVGSNASSTWTGNPRDKYLTIAALECMNIPETGGEKSLDQCEILKDREGVTYSWCSLTQGETCQGSLVTCIMNHYSALNPSDPDLEEIKREVKRYRSTKLQQLLAARTRKREMIQATIRTYANMYYAKALKNVEKIGVTTPLGIISVIRMTTHFPNNIYKAQQDRGLSGGKGMEPLGRGAEADKAWLLAFWKDYRTAGLGKWGGWVNEADVWIKQCETNNMDLQQPISWKPNWKPVVTLGKPSLPMFEEYADLFVEENIWS